MRFMVYHDNPSGIAACAQIGDAWSADRENMIFSVADSPLRFLTRFSREYPTEDFGYRAASTYCAGVERLARKCLSGKEFSEKNMRQCLVSANADIAELNAKIGKKYDDPLNYDVAETVGASAVIHNGNLYFGMLEDCYVQVLRGKKYENILKIKYRIKKSARYMDRMLAGGNFERNMDKSLKSRVGKQIWEPFWCNMLRNNTEIVDENGNKIGWGCFTGEKEAGDFFQVGSLKLEKGDLIAVFSDGMIPVLSNYELFAWIAANFGPTLKFQAQLRQKIMREFAVDHKEVLRAGDIESENKLPECDHERTLILFEYE